VTQEFSLSVTPVQDDTYLIRTERVSPGVPLAEEIVTWEVADWLSRAAQLMNDPLVGLLRGNGGTSPSTSEPSGDLVTLGQDLYNALFQGTVRDSWMVAQGIAQHKQDILRLRLGLKGDRLPRLPWEVLHAIDRPLSTGTDVVFSRYQASLASLSTSLPFTRAKDVGQPLRILMVVAAPQDQERLRLNQEVAHLQTELQRENGDRDRQLPPIEMTRLEQPGRESLTQALEQGNFDILHYAGHSNLGAAGGDLYLVNEKTGLTEVLNGDDLAGLLVNNGVRMAVFNSCRGMQSASANSYDVGNLADALLRRGIPAVLAMAERIPDDVALNLSRLFYRNLKQGYSIDLSLNRARQGLLSSYGSSQLYWALPILYLHPEFDGHLRGAQSQESEEPNWEPNFPAFEDLENPEDYDRDRADIAQLFSELVQEPGFTDAALPEHPAQPLQPAIADASQISHSTQGQMAQDAQQFFRLAQVLQQQGDLTGAIEALGDALKLDPNNAAIYHQLGGVFQAYGNLPDAMRSYKLALQLDPSCQPAQNAIHRLTQGTSPSHLSPAEPSESDAIAPSPAQKANFGDRKPAPKPAFPWAIAGSLGIAATALIGIGVTASRWIPTSLPNVQNSPTQINPTQTRDAEQLFTRATQHFQQEELRQGIETVHQMLDQGAIVQAEQALQMVPDAQRDIAPVAFVRGRIAWESFNSGGMTAGGLDDARRGFEKATQEDPNNALYQNAWGFALYEEGRLDAAIGAWLRANDLAAQQPNSPDALTAYAGLALGLMQDANRPANKKGNELRRSALKLRDRALQANPQAFTEEALAKNWLWSQKAMADWQKLTAMQTPKP
jgi:tetratricopeptide (TPR) repeat protein